jgi:hypothetical protein
MKILIIEQLWQHTEVIGIWLDFYKDHDITVYYPEYNKNQHNYIHIWQKIFNFKLDIIGNISPSLYDIVLLNTTIPDVAQKMLADFPSIKLLAVEHYSVQTIKGKLDSVCKSQICDLPVQPFSSPGTCIIPVCPRLADLLVTCRSAIPIERNILIIGNSFKNTPATLFNSFIYMLQSSGYTLKAVLYGYNDLSGYNFSLIDTRKDISAIDLYAEVESARFILFLPADYHFMNQGSGSLVHSLQFGRPLITMPDFLTLYNIKSYYSIGDPNLLKKFDDTMYYKEAQSYYGLCLNEIIANNSKILENKTKKILG